MQELLARYQIRLLLYIVLVAAAAFVPIPESERRGTLRAESVPSAVSVTLVAPAPPPKPSVTPPPKPKIPPKPKALPKPKPKPEPAPVVKPVPRTLPEPEAAQPPQELSPVTEETVPSLSETPALRQQEIPAAVADTRLMAYQSSVRERIFALKRYPKQARRLHHEGSVTVRFWINGDGTMQRFELIEKSGLATLDGATEQLFEHIPGFEVPPEGVALPYELTITLRYALQ